MLYSPADEHVARIRRREHPSLILVASNSEYFLTTAAAVLGPAAANGHSLRSVRIKPDPPSSLGAADLISCDSRAYPIVCGARPRAEVVRHELIAPACLDRIESVLAGYSRMQESAD